MNKSQLIALREKIKAHKPSFRRHDSANRREVSPSWRYPRGLHNKIALGKRGKPDRVKIGYGGPALARGLDARTGLMPVIISTPNDLAVLDRSLHAAIISATVGMQKRAIIVKKAQEMGIIVLNCKKPEEFLKSVAAELDNRKKSKANRANAKAEKAKAKAAAKPKLAEKVEAEGGKKDAEKKELDKLLTKKES
jgi:large subunit ribosomal protein L32e